MLAANNLIRPMLKLRPYQSLAIAAITASWQRVDRTLVQMATGAGKTIVFGAVLQQHLKGTAQRGIVLVHRQELLHQAAAKIRQVWPEVDLGIVQRKRLEWDHQIVVASIPTLYRRLDQVPLQNLGMVIVDEAHHAPARSWQKVLNTLTAQGAKCLGVTATPERDKRVGLGEVFEELCFSCALPDLIPQYLADLRAIRLETDLPLDQVRSRQGDFMPGDLERVVNTSARNQLIVEGWMRYGEGRPAVVYCVSVQHARQVAAAFESFGIRAATVDGQQTPAQRQATLNQFYRHDVQILTNCLVLTEGWDYPELSCLILARPTQSSLLFTQMVGRGTRQAHGKTDCLILDLADTTKRHQLQSVHRLFGLAPTVDLRQQGAAQAARRQQAAEAQRLRREARQLARMDRVLVDLLLQATPSLPSRYEWTPLAGGCWVLTVPDQEPRYGGDVLQIRYTPDLGAGLHHLSARGIRELVSAPDLAHLVTLADAWIDKHLRFAAILLDQQADWRQHPASEMQKSYIRTLLRRLPPSQAQLYEQITAHLRQIETATALREVYEAQGSALPATLEARQLTKGVASRLITFLKAQLAKPAREQP